MTRDIFWLLISCLLLINCDDYHPHMDYLERTRQKRSVEKYEDAAYWLKSGQDELNEALQLENNKKLAKNIVLVIGDGMSISTITGGRIYKGQTQGNDGPGASLSWEKFPNIGLSKTYNTNAMVPDSAATAFSMYSGVKTNFFTMGYDSSIQWKNADSQLTAKEVDTVLDWAQEADMNTGLVTTARVTHATPAALYAKTANRDWECDLVLPYGVPSQVKDIARQLIDSERGQKMKVVLGGGRGAFTVNDDFKDKFNCSRLDGEDLIKRWQLNHPKGQFVSTKSQLLDLNITETENIFGLFSHSHMPYDDTLNENQDAPSLVNMTTVALDLLMSQSKEKGFFLMVEAGRIDHANHYAQATRALSETVAMDRAVEEIVRRVGDDTLVIVTADHSHTLSVSGYPGRRADITGVVKSDNGWIMRADDGHTMSILSYANGPGFKKLVVKEPINSLNWESIQRAGDLSENQKGDHSFVFPGAVPLGKETHGGDDVGIFAKGPWSHLFHSVHEQSYIGHVMSYAACIGPNRKRNPNCGSRLLLLG